MDFVPTYCPRTKCPSRALGSFRFTRRGSFTRGCDGRVVQRYRCSRCRRFFSEQSFRIDYRLRYPDLHHVLLRDFVSKVTHRQSARTLGFDRKTIHHRLQLLGGHCRELQERLLERAGRAGVSGWNFQLDELETFEERRRLQPVTVPVVIERPTRFIVGVSVGRLPARGKLRPAERICKARLELASGRRPNESRAAVREALGFLTRLVGTRSRSRVESDFKTSYPGLIREAVGPNGRHQQHSSTAKRNRGNPLFPINHTLAMLRDGISRLVRRSWAASKRRARLLDHMWIWIAWRNYVRPITNDSGSVTPAMALGVLAHPLSGIAMTTWRVGPQ